MSQVRKVKAEIESTFKKIREGIDEFDSIWDRVYESETQTQKEKFEGDLKRQIKKLQRLRDILKPWSQSSDPIINQYSNQISDMKRKIETKMEQFRECEKETKTKAFSKEGLRQQNRQNPHDEKLEGAIDRVRKLMTELQKQIEDCEVEEKREKLKKKNINTTLVDKLEGYIKNHHWHISNLELVLRQLDNELIDPYDIEGILDDVDDYLDNYRQKDYVFDNSVYDELDLSVAVNSEEDDDDSNDEDESHESTSIPTSPQVPPPSPVTLQRVPSGSAKSFSPNQSTTPTLPKPIQTPPTRIMSPPSSIPVTSPQRKPTLNYAQVIQRAIVNHTDVQKPSPSVQSPSKPQSPEIKKLPSPVITEPSFTPPSLPPVESQWNRIELLDFLSDSYTEFTEQSHLDSTPLSFPSNPVCIPSCFPQVPKKELFDASVIKSMDSDTLLFAYGYALSDSQRFLIAKALVDKGWKYDREGKTWVMETNGEYKVYDYSHWSIQNESKVKQLQLEVPPLIQ